MHKRQLPWRDTSDPYRIWVSEVILQQTRVDQGLNYYHRFLERFPDVVSLAQAPLEDVMKTWQGLGYYSRARHMHEAAKDICNRFNAEFPSAYDELIQLKGIGDYSASAISSIAFGESRPVIDGNVMRVVARYFGITQPVNTTPGNKQVRHILEGQIDRARPGTFNQAVMELGALVCLPRKPLCRDCPLQSGCYALARSMTGSLPVLRKPGPKSVHHYVYMVALMQEGDRWYTWLRKRVSEGIWKHLYDFPLEEAEKDMSSEELLNSVTFRELTRQVQLTGRPPLVEKTRHILSHRDLRITFVVAHVSASDQQDCQKTALEDLHKYPVPRLIEIFLKKLLSDRVYF
jgi:A/G-specific adenine glycosylase